MKGSLKPAIFILVVLLCESGARSKGRTVCKYAGLPDAQNNSYAIHGGVCQRCQTVSDLGIWGDRPCSECRAALKNATSRPPSHKPAATKPPVEADHETCEDTHSDGARRYKDGRYEVCTWGPDRWIETAPDPGTICVRKKAPASKAP